jgi:hypothetical protein
MKKIYLVIVVFFICIAQSFNAQTNWSLHSYDDSPKLLVNVNGFQFFVNTTKSNSFGNVTDTTGIMGVMPNGKIKFRHHSTPFDNVKSVIKTNDNCVVLVGEMNSSCDFLPNSKPCVLLKLDTNGVVQFTQTLTVTYTANAQAQPFTTVIQKPDSSYLVFSEGYFHQYSKSGNFSSTQTHTLGSINSSALTSNTTIIVSHSINSGTTTINALSLIDLNGNVVNTATTTSVYTKLKKSSTTDCYGLTGDSTLHKINSSLIAINTTSLSQAGDFITDFDLQLDSIYACGIRFNYHQSIIYKFDNNLSYILSRNFTKSSFYFTGISYQGDSLNIIAKDKPATFNTPSNIFNYSTSFLKADLFGQTDCFQDASVIYISTETGYAYTTVPSSSLSPITNHFIYSLKVKVYNSGYYDTLKSVYINWHPISIYNFQDVACGYHYYHQLFTGLSIAPGDSTILITNIILEDITHPTNQPLVAGTSYTLPTMCVWTSAPNFKCDMYHTNDTYCGDVVLPVTTGLNEHTTETIAVTAYPNPTSDKLLFTHIKDGINYTVSCYDITGKENHTQLITVQNNEMNIGSLNNGIYILKISDGMHTVHQKIIKQD